MSLPRWNLSKADTIETSKMCPLYGSVCFTEVTLVKTLINQKATRYGQKLFRGVSVLERFHFIHINQEIIFNKTKKEKEPLTTRLYSHQLYLYRFDVRITVFHSQLSSEWFGDTTHSWIEVTLYKEGREFRGVLFRTDVLRGYREVDFLQRCWWLWTCLRIQIIDLINKGSNTIQQIQMNNSICKNQIKN